MDKPYTEWTITEKIEDIEKELKHIESVYTEWDTEKTRELEIYYGDGSYIVIEKLKEYLSQLKKQKGQYNANASIQ